ncbi:MAG: SCO family protein [Pseudomonadota bacterium]|nr:SCO family protein [Pseudomonadota bacterium]
MNRLALALPFLLLLACAPEAPAPVAPAPVAPALQEAATPVVVEADVATQQGSVYALDLDLVDQAGRTVPLDAQRGHPVLLSMFYTSCPMACPMLITEIQSIEAELPAELLAGVRVVLVSMDPANDDPAAMRTVVEKHGLDARWTLGAVPANDVRLVAAALGVRYRPLPEGGYAHTSVITLVDAQGHVVARAEGREGREVLVAALARLAATAPGHGS